MQLLANLTSWLLNSSPFSPETMQLAAPGPGGERCPQVQAALHEGGRHTVNSLICDAKVDQELRMRAVGHSDRSVNDRYTHPPIEAHLAAAEQTAALVRKAGERT